MYKINIAIIFFVICVSAFTQSLDFESTYINLINDDSYDKTFTWLNTNREQNDMYMNACPRNIVSIAYENKKFKSMDAAINFDKKLLYYFIPSCAGGHASNPPTIFKCLQNNDIKYVEHFLNKGVPISITWEIIARLPENLFSMAKSDEMRTLLTNYKCPQLVEVNRYICEINDNQVNVRDKPGLNGVKLFQVNTGKRGKLIKITPIKESINGNTNKWYFIEFENDKSGWVFGQFVHVFWLDGM